MRKKIRILFVGCFLFTFFTHAQALEQKIEGLSASVEVAPVFSISLNNPNISFGLLSPGHTRILGEGFFANELKCRSNSGRTWYVNVQLLSLKLFGKDSSLSPSYFKYRIVDLQGSAASYARTEFKEFFEKPMLIYQSQGDDNRGREVILRFQYSLTAPLDTPAGDYTGQLIFTMTESQ